jgi:hypothetical protein
LLAHFALALGVSVTMPILEEYDETSHVLFVRYLQTYHALPAQTTDTEAARAHHPPAYYFLGALLTNWVRVTNATDKIFLEPNPNYRIEPNERDPDNKLRWVHYGPNERWPYQDLPLLVHLLRLLTAAFSTLGALFTYLTARQLRPNDAVFALLAAALLAFNPEVVFDAGLVYNDSPALTGAAAMLYVLCRFERSGWTWWRWAIVGAVLGLGTLLKLNVLTLAPLAAGLWAIDALRRMGPGQSRPWAARLTGLLQAILAGCAFALPFLALTGWWFWRNYQLYGDLTANAVIVQMWGAPPQHPWWVYVQQLWNDPLGHFGTGEWVSFPGWAYGLAQAALVASSLSAVALAIRWLRRAPRPWLQPAFVLWGMVILNLAFGFLSVLSYAVQVVGFAHVRYLFPIFPALMIALAAGALGWMSATARRWVALLSTGALLAASVYAIFGLILPVFGPPPTPSAADLAQSHPVEAHIDDVARILGYTVKTTTTPAEVQLTVRVYWLPLRQTPQPYSVFIHLLAPTSLAQRDTYPGQGNWATTVWDVKRPFVDVYRLRFSPAELPLADPQLVLGLYDRNTMERLPVSGADTSGDDRWVRLGTWDGGVK